MNAQRKAALARANLAQANAVRLARAAQRRELVAAPTAEVLAVLREPPAELMTYRLRELFGADAGSIIASFGLVRLGKALGVAEERRPHGRHWHSDLRLDEVGDADRNRLVDAIAEVLGVDA